MFPWFWIWAPQFPFSDFTVSPQTDWSIGNTASGNPRLEQHIHQDVASYGRQIGWLSEVLLQLAGSETVTQQQALESLARLEKLRGDIEALKVADRATTQDQAIALLDKLARSDPDGFVRVLQRFMPPQPLLPGQPG